MTLGLVIAAGSTMFSLLPANADSATIVSQLRNTCSAYDAGVDSNGTIICYTGNNVVTDVPVVAFCDNHATTLDFLDTSDINRSTNLGSGDCAIVKAPTGDNGLILITSTNLVPSTLSDGTASTPSEDQIEAACGTKYQAGYVTSDSPTPVCINTTVRQVLHLVRICNIHAPDATVADTSIVTRTTIVGTAVCVYYGASGDAADIILAQQ